MIAAAPPVRVTPAVRRVHASDLAVELPKPYRCQRRTAVVSLTVIEPLPPGWRVVDGDPVGYVCGDCAGRRTTVRPRRPMQSPAEPPPPVVAMVDIAAAVVEQVAVKPQGAELADVGAACAGERPSAAAELVDGDDELATGDVAPRTGFAKLTVEQLAIIGELERLVCVWEGLARLAKSLGQVEKAAEHRARAASLERRIGAVGARRAA